MSIAKLFALYANVIKVCVLQLSDFIVTGNDGVFAGQFLPLLVKMARLRPELEGFI